MSTDRIGIYIPLFQRFYHDFTAMIENAQFNYYVLDHAGDTEYDGNFHRLYAGPLTFLIVTELESATFPEGGITGRVMSLGIAEAGAPFLYADWRSRNFDSEEQTDEGVSGPPINSLGARNGLRRRWICKQGVMLEI